MSPSFPRRFLERAPHERYPQLHLRMVHALHDAAVEERQRYPDHDISLSTLGALATAATAVALQLLEEERERLGLTKEGAAQ